MSSAEVSIGLVCLALTTYKPLFKLDFFQPKRTEQNKEVCAREEGFPATEDKGKLTQAIAEVGEVKYFSNTTVSGRPQKEDETPSSTSMELLTRPQTDGDAVETEPSPAMEERATSWFDTDSIDESRQVHAS